jgi:hypothetical protein
MEKTILYFETKGPSNTDKTLAAVKQRAIDLGIKYIVIATTHGSTALQAAEVFLGTAVHLVAASISEAFQNEGWILARDERRRLEAKGISVLPGLHSLGDNVASAYIEKFGGMSAESLVRETLYRFSQGMKVCVEIVLMAADAGLIPLDQEVIAIGGSSSGADTAIVVKPAYSMKFLDMEIREIIAKPRIP